MPHNTITVWSARGSISEYPAFYRSAAYKKTRLQKNALAVCLVLLLFLGLQSAFTFVRPALSSSRVIASSSEAVQPSGGPSSPSIAPIPVHIIQPQEQPDTISPRLQALLGEWQKTHIGRKWAVQVEGLENARFSASLNADINFRSASIFKLYLSY